MALPVFEEVEIQKGLGRRAWVFKYAHFFLFAWFSGQSVLGGLGENPLTRVIRLWPKTEPHGSGE